MLPFFGGAGLAASGGFTRLGSGLGGSFHLPHLPPETKIPSLLGKFLYNQFTEVNPVDKVIRLDTNQS